MHYHLISRLLYRIEHTKQFLSLVAQAVRGEISQKMVTEERWYCKKLTEVICKHM